MGSFDDFLGKAREMADAATKATGEVIEISKQKYQASKMASEIQRTYEKLGKIVYDGKKLNVDNSKLIDTVISEIDTLTSELDELNRKMSNSKPTVTCPSCGNTNPEGSFYCSRCGASIEKNDN